MVHKKKRLKIGNQDKFWEYHKKHQGHRVVYRGLGYPYDWYCYDCNWWC